MRRFSAVMGWIARRGWLPITFTLTILGTMQPIAQAQFFSGVQGAWQRVYEQLPTFPQENQYVSLSTGSAQTSSTLASRLIQYHVFVKRRLPTSRLDWKFTLADYLGINEVMYEGQYPGVPDLKTSPFERDRTIIRQFSREQRESLIQALVKALQPQRRTGQTSPQQQDPTPQQATSSPSIAPSPQSGDADLLRL